MRKLLSCVLIACILITAVPAMGMVSASASIEIGNYIQMGTYYGEPILWRCVAFEKISGYDDNGNPIIDSTDTVTEYKDGYLPLMLSDKILCLKAFDATGSNSIGSHGRGYVENGISGYWRQNSYSSNYWGDSNIRCWLNSDCASGKVLYTCGNAPNSEKLEQNAYADEAGFLHNFLNTEKELVAKVSQKSILDGFEYSQDINSNYHRWGSTITDCVQNYSTSFSEYITDKMFLLDVKQINTVYNNRNVLGNDYYIGKPTQNCIDNNMELENEDLSIEKGWYNWLRTPDAHLYHPHRGSRNVRGIHIGGEISNTGANNPSFGVRPAFFLNIDNADFPYGDGSENNPYAMEDNRKSATYRSELLKCNKPLQFDYSDNYFIDNNGYTYNHDLAKASLALELSSWTPFGAEEGSEADRMYNIKNLYNELGFDKDSIKPSNYDDPLSDNTDKVAYTFASKPLYDGSTLIAVVVRGGGYGAEWRSNFHVGSGTKHIGFNTPAEEIYQNLSEYLSGYDTNNTKIWITGYSRGAAIANLVSGKINETGLIDRNNLYSYLFAVPNGVIVAAHDANNSIHDNIYNIVLPYDVVPKVALQRWGYGKYGKTLSIKNRDAIKTLGGVYLATYPNEKLFHELTNKYYKIEKAHTKAGNKATDILYSLADSSNAYVNTYESLFMDIVEWAMCRAHYQSLTEFVYERYGRDTKFPAAINHAITYSSTEYSKFAYLDFKNIDAFSLDILLYMNGIVMTENELMEFIDDTLADLLNNIGFCDLIKTGTGIGGGMEAHNPEYYISWLYGYDNPKNIYETSTYKKLTVACPVNVNVYDSYGDLVASVEKNNIVVDTLPIEVIGDSTEIYFYDTDDIDDYSIEVTAYDQGLVNYSISEYTDNEVETRKINYSNIPVENGTTLTGDIPKGQSLEADVYNLTVTNNEIETTVEYAEDLSGDELKNLSVLVTVEGDGTAQDILYATKGELVTLEATPYFDAEFIGWYDENGSLLSTDKNYTFVLSENMNVTAKFSKCTAKLVFNEIPCVTDDMLSVDGIISAGKNINGRCFVAVYSKDGSLLVVKLADVSLSNDTPYRIDEEFDVSLYDKEPSYVKLFLWEDMKPLTLFNSISILPITNADTTN